MQKKTYNDIQLNCVFQHVTDLPESACLPGIISRHEDGFRFEESCARKVCTRNPKLFDGQYCSLVHMQNGKYQIHMKTINASQVTDRNALAFNVYSELLTALAVID
jgi:hypothetical protein